MSQSRNSKMLDELYRADEELATILAGKVDSDLSRRVAMDCQANIERIKAVDVADPEPRAPDLGLYEPGLVGDSFFSMDVAKARPRWLVALTVYLAIFTAPNPALGYTEPPTEQQIAEISAFDKLAQVSDVREKLAQRAARVIGLDKPWTDGEMRYGGLNAKQADAVTVIAEIFGEAEFDHAVRVAWCESRLSPDAVNGNGNRNKTVDRGLFMLNDGGTMQRLDVNSREAFDAREATKAALVLFQDRGWQPWVCAKLIGIDKLK